VVTGLVLAELVPADELARPEFALVDDVVARVVVVVVAVVFALTCASTGS
jgi:hypothetical protein